MDFEVPQRPPTFRSKLVVEEIKSVDEAPTVSPTSKTANQNAQNDSAHRQTHDHLEITEAKELDSHERSGNSIGSDTPKPLSRGKFFYSNNEKKEHWTNIYS